MAGKSKPASLTGDLLASKGNAGPASAPKADSPAVPRLAPEPDSVEILTDGTGGFRLPMRLDPAVYVELRLAAARAGTSCEEIVRDALIRYLAELSAVGSGLPEPQVATE